MNTEVSLKGDIYKKVSQTSLPREYSPKVVFQCSDFNIHFRSAVSNVPTNESHLDGNIYRPPYNEVSAEYEPMINLDDYALFAEDVTLEGFSTGSQLYLKSKFEMTTKYTEHIFGPDGNLYQISKSKTNKKVYQGNQLLTVESCEDGVMMTEVESGVTVPVEREKFTEIIDDEDTFGAIKVEEGASAVTKIAAKLG